MSKSCPKTRPPPYDKKAETIRVQGELHHLAGINAGTMFNLLRTKQVSKQAFYHWLYLEVDNQMASFGSPDSVLTKFHQSKKEDEHVQSEDIL